MAKNLLFANVIMYNHKFCNLMRWYERMNMFTACTCQATWIGAHLLGIFDIWFKKTPPELPGLKQTDSSVESISVPSSEPNMEQVDDKGCPPPPEFISNSRPISYEVNNRLSNRWNICKIIEYPSFF